MTVHHDALAEKIARELEEDIAFGRLLPGQKLPEEELSERFAASRHHIREALTRLTLIGVVSRERNRGATVRRFGAEETGQVYEVREVLQRQAALRIPLPASPAAIENLEGIHRDYEAAVAHGDLRRIHAVNDYFHLELFRLGGNETLAQLIKQFMDLTYAIRANSFNPHHLATAVREHATMIRLLATRDSWALAQICVDHIEYSKDKYLDMLARESAAGAASPVDAARAPTFRVAV